jgi:1-acyl-sn-glycerol-3-phosphate acyltransferase
MNIKAGLQQLAHLALRVFLKIHCGFKVRGTPKLDRPSLLVANHASHIDIAAIFAALPISEVPKVRTAAAKDAIYGLPKPVLGVVEFLFNTYPFERKSKSSGSLEFGADALRDGCHLAIFPEGKRDDGRFLGFTPGFAKIAYQTGAPVVPIRIEGAHKAMPRHADTIGRHPLRVEFKAVLEADRTVPYERRQEEYARLVTEANAAVGA